MRICKYSLSLSLSLSVGGGPVWFVWIWLAGRWWETVREVSHHLLPHCSHLPLQTGSPGVSTPCQRPLLLPCFQLHTQVRLHFPAFSTPQWPYLKIHQRKYIYLHLFIILNHWRYSTANNHNQWCRFLKWTWWKFHSIQCSTNLTVTVTHWMTFTPWWMLCGRGRSLMMSGRQRLQRSWKQS